VSEEYTVHVRPKGDARAIDFVHDVEAAIGARFSPDAASGGLVVRTSTQIVYAFLEHVPFEDDENVPFSRYPWYLEQTPNKTESARQATQVNMLSIYHALVDTGRYGCCLVYALSELLANNDGLTSRATPGA
jgi:hypothetical protein